MRITFRTDASLEIGAGHVMRCLTLADALSAKGAVCEFICRLHEGNLVELVRSKGYVVHAMTATTFSSAEPETSAQNPINGSLAHAAWLGATQAEDAEACAAILSTNFIDWLIVDHYALDARWERALAPYCSKLMVIDDLADRQHRCDLLLDQTFGRELGDYFSLVPTSCRLLCGSQYALLRPEFSALRPYSLERRTRSTLREFLVSMGGVDNANATGQVLKVLRSCTLPTDCRITVVMGANAPWIDAVHELAQELPWRTRVLIGVSHMAQIMADSDLAVGAAGATSWERCCLGLPSAILVLADNQVNVAQSLELAGAAAFVDPGPRIEYQLQTLVSTLVSSPDKLSAMSRSAAAIVDGTGTAAVASVLDS